MSVKYFPEILLELGLNPQIPQKAAGILMLPPISLPILRGVPPIATNPASPPELPPVVLVISQGFSAVPYILLVVSIHINI